MDSRFIQAVKSSIIEMEVCGRILKPMSMRHRLVLTEIESPVILTDNPFEPSDLVIAARILSTHDLKEMLCVKPTDDESLKFTELFLDSGYYEQEMHKMADYIKFNDNMPIIWDKKRNGAGRGINLVLSCVTNLMRNGMSYEQAWTMNECEAMWMYIANLVSDGGDITVITEEDVKAMEFLKQLESSKA
jgi:hypothetical protein